MIVLYVTFNKRYDSEFHSKPGAMKNPGLTSQ